MWINTEICIFLSIINRQPLRRVTRREEWRETLLAEGVHGHENPKNQAVTLLPLHAYILLPRSHTLHPFTIFSFQHFTKKTINKLSSTHMTLEEAVTLQLLCSSTLESNLEVKFTNFIIIDQNKETTTNQPNTPLASATTPNNYINQFAQLP